MLLDDVHDAPRHSGDAAGARPPGPGHGPSHRGGHHEKVRPRGTIRVRRAQLLGAHQAQDLGALRRTVLVHLRKGKLYYFTAAGEVCVRVRFFVCSQDYAKTTQRIFTKFGGKVPHGPRKNPLDSGSNPGHVTYG